MRVSQEFRDLKVDKFFPEVKADLDMNSQRIEELAPAATDTDAVSRLQLGNVIAADITSNTTQGIVLTKTQSGSNSGDEMVISASDSSPTQKGTVIIEPASGEAVNVAYSSGTATIGVDRSKATQQGVVTVSQAPNEAVNVSYTADGEVRVGVDKSTASQQGVVQITTPVVTNGNPITLTRPSDGEIELSIADGAIDVQKIKGLDKADTSEYASNWDNDDDQVATVGAIAKRLDAIVSTSQPTNAQIGKFWYNPAEGINALYMWNGTEWKVLTSGTPYIPVGTTIVRYVDTVNGSDASGNSGFLPQSPLKTIKRAITLINASASGDGTLVVVEPGVYQEVLPLRIEKNNVSVVGKSLRSCFIHPTVATENNNMWEVDSGTYISGFTMLGLKVPTNDQGSRNNAIDNDASYGLPSNQPFAVSFRSGDPVILKSPYIQNCTHFSDAHFDNANFDPNTFPSTDAQTYSAVAGDQTSAPCGGGLLVDGSVPAQTSPIRSMVVDAFTQITLDGPGILVTNNGYAQLVSFFGTFCHYHAKAKNGGQINLSNCVTDFGRYGLIAEGKSPTAIATATASAANSGATTVTIGAISTAGTFHGTVSRPLDHMMITIDGADYGVVSSAANGSGWDVTITPALASNISNTAVSFALRSYISTGGHTFEYVGVGTDYSDHPDNGGVALEANQVKQLSGGKVWQSSTDHIGKFKAGNVLTVDQIAETLAVNGNITVTGTNAVNGNITVTGTVDGRDVATDGTKLDGIEAGATADQTAAEIRTLVESATDSNVFTDADHTKLNGIAAGAEVNVNADWNATSGDAQILNKPSIPSAYGDSNVDAHLNRSTASSGEVLSWNGSDYDWIAAAAGYSDSNVDSHLNRSTASNGEVLSWNGSDYDWVAPAAGGATDINGLSDAKTQQSGQTIGIGTGALAVNSGDNYNLAVGYQALNDNTNGQYNVAIGQTALSLNVSGLQNTAVGYQALYQNTTHSNTAVGKSAMSGVTTGGNNSGVGFNVLGSLTTGTGNCGIGKNAGFNLTTGSNNIVIGNGATASSANAQNQITLGDTNVTSLRIPGLQSGASSGHVLTYNGTDITLAAGGGPIPMVSKGSINTSASYGIGYNALANDDASHNENTAFGIHALGSNTSGAGNVAIGRYTLSDSTTGGSNVGVGNAALHKNTTGTKNVAIGGANTMRDNTTGTNNVAVGFQALKSNTTASRNVAIGYEAVFSNTSGAFNVAAGYQALYSCTTGNSNVANGYQTLRGTTTGSGNVATGWLALYSNTTGSNNAAYGYGALKSNTTGGGNVGVGYEALGGLGSSRDFYSSVGIGHQALANTTSSNNTAVGYQAGTANTSGHVTAFGKSAGAANTTGGVTAFGISALQNNTSGLGNTAVGEFVLDANNTGNSNTAVGKNALTANTSGTENQALGYYALSGTTTGSYNTAMGKDAGNNTTTGNYNTSIGYEAKPSSSTASGEITLGNSNASTLRCNTQTISSLSDARDKTEVQPLVQGLNFIDSLQPVKFKWETRDGNVKDGTYEAGFIAQDLQSAQSEVDADYLGLVIDENPERLEASYGKLIPVLVQAIKDLKSEIETLKSNV